MDRDELLTLLKRVETAQLPPQEAVEALVNSGTIDLGHSLLDGRRALRTGVPEVVYAEGKTQADFLGLMRASIEKFGRVLATRLKEEHFEVLESELPEVSVHRVAKIALFDPCTSSRGTLGSLAVVAAGTSDRPLLEETSLCAEYFRLSVEKFIDVGVAGLPRLLDRLEAIRAHDVIVVIAGMEGALPSVLAGLVEAPIVAVPSSVGYGANFGGITALLGMLVSCSPGVSVVNIDNGFGAALSAYKMVRHLKADTQAVEFLKECNSPYS